MISLVTVNTLLSKKLVQMSEDDEHLIHRQQCEELVTSFKDRIKSYTRKELKELRAIMKIYFLIEPMLLVKDYLYQINKLLKEKSR